MIFGAQIMLELDDFMGLSNREKPPQSSRSLKLTILDEEELEELGLSASGHQKDTIQGLDQKAFVGIR
jgi:hypothetical protein